MKAVFVSDAHLKFIENWEDKIRRTKFLSFLATLKGNTDLLVLNGDIFDLWVAWKHVIIKEYFPVLNILSDLKSSGTRLVMTAGNHDFWFSGFLREEIGIEIYPNSFIETINGKKFFVNHGDRFTKNDLRYQIFRSIIRNQIVKGIFSLIHPDLALEFGIMMSRSSRKRKIPLKRRELMVRSLKDAARKLLISGEYDYIIFSHSHVPVMVDFEEGVYANCGDWVTHSSYLEYIEGKLILKEY